MAYYELDAPLAYGAEQSERALFMRRTYAHLAGAVLAFVAMEFAIFMVLPKETLDGLMLQLFRSRFSYMVLFGLFIAAGYIAQWWAHSSTSRAMQYAGLGLYVAAWAVMFVPLLWIAINFIDDPSLLPTAAILTLCVFGGLTVAVLTTGKDFSFLGPILSIGGFIILGVIIAAMFFPIGLGLGFSFLMVAFASISILYSTSNVLHHYRTDQYVGAALELFASLALLLWYILQILMATSNRN